MKQKDSFFDQVYAVVKLIPEGRVTSYGAIAEYLGTKGSARMVGWAMNASHTEVSSIPAHRVVNRNGLLTGKHHFGGGNIMQQLLENEGIEIKDDQILDFEKHFWNPQKELDKNHESIFNSYPHTLTPSHPHTLLPSLTL